MSKKKTWGAALPTDDEIDEIMEVASEVDEFEPIDITEIIEEEKPVVNTTKAVQDLNLMAEGKMTNLEKDELKTRVDAMRDEERDLTIRRFTTDELYSEIGRRLKKNDNYMRDMKTLIDRYYEEG